MKLVIGGAYQGKTDYVMKKYNIPREKMLDENSFDINKVSEFSAVNHFHLILKNTDDQEELCRGIIEKNPEMIFILDEIGCGIIPIDRSERLWRERVGKAGCYLAERAESVERIICGMSVKIK